MRPGGLVEGLCSAQLNMLRRLQPSHLGCCCRHALGCCPMALSSTTSAQQAKAAAYLGDKQGWMALCMGPHPYCPGALSKRVLLWHHEYMGDSESHIVLRDSC